LGRLWRLAVCRAMLGLIRWFLGLLAHRALRAGTGLTARTARPGPRVARAIRVMSGPRARRAAKETSAHREPKEFRALSGPRVLPAASARRAKSEKPARRDQRAPPRLSLDPRVQSVPLARRAKLGPPQQFPVLPAPPGPRVLRGLTQPFRVLRVLPAQRVLRGLIQLSLAQLARPERIRLFRVLSARQEPTQLSLALRGQRGRRGRRAKASLGLRAATARTLLCLALPARQVRKAQPVRTEPALLTRCLPPQRLFWVV
jgi:hypothetical protein